MAKLKDGFYKQTAETVGSDLFVLLAGGGMKPLADFATSTLDGVATEDWVSKNYLALSGGTLKGNLIFKNGTGNATCLPAHIYRNIYDTSGNVYDHYYNAETTSTYSYANLRVKSGDSYRVLRFGGDGNFSWNGSVVITAGNISNYALTTLPDHTHAYLPLAGGLMTDAATIQWGNNKTTWDNVPNGFIGISNLSADSTLGYYAGMSFKGYYGMQLRNYGGGNSLEFRGHNSSTWQPWVTIITSSNYNSYSPTLAGVGATGTWSINITGSAGSAGSASTANIVSHSTYYYDGNVMKNDTSAHTIFGDNAKANYLFPSFMQAQPTWNGWADVLNFTGYCKWGGTQIATEYNAIKPRIAIRKFNQSRSDWGDWVEFITSGNLTSQISDWNSTVLSVFKSSENKISNAPTQDFCYGIHLRFHRDTRNYFTDLVTTLYGDNLYYRRHTESGYSSWKRLAFTEDIPTSLKNPNAIKFKNTSGVEVSYDGSAAVDLTGGINYASIANLLNTVTISEADFNKSPRSGFYNVTKASTTTLPGTVTSGNIAIHACWDNGTNTAALDFLINDSTSSNLYYRASVGGQKGSWKTVLDTSNYTSYTVKKDGTGASGTWGINISGTATNADTLDGINSTGFLRKITVANNTENDFNTFENMTLTGRGDPTTGASLKNAPWSGQGPAGGYGVLTYLWSGYGTQMAWGYNSNRIYIRSKYYANSTATWSTNWDSLALTSDLKNPSDYYWANLSVQSSASDTTVPSFGAIRLNGVASAGTNYITGTAGRIFFGGNFHIDAVGANHLYLNHYTGYNVYMCSGSSQGKVSIGFTSPLYKFDIRNSESIDYDFHIYNSTTKASLYVGHEAFWYGTSKTGTANIFSINSGCAYDGGGGTNVFRVSASGIVTASSYVNATRFHLSNTAADYCGLMPNSVITTGGNAADIWLYNDNKVSIYGSSIDLTNTTTVRGLLYFDQASSNRNRGIIGSYDPNRAAAIWSMGSSYQISTDGLSFGSLYGAAYAYFGSGYTFGAGYSGGHSFVWCQGGTPVASLGDYVWARHGFLKNGSSDSYVLLGGGSHKALSDFSMTHSHPYLPLAGGTMTGVITMNVGTGIQMKYDRATDGNPWIYANGADAYGIRYFEGDPDKMVFSASGNAKTPASADLCINGNGEGTVTIRGKNIIHAGNIGSQSVNYASSANYANSCGNADTVDNLHASSFVKFYLSPMDASAPADSAKGWFTNTMPSASGAIVYNVPGSEKTIIAGKSSGPYGHMLQLNYDDTYLRILRYFGGSWKSTDWEKISAGYADSSYSSTYASNLYSGASASDIYNSGWYRNYNTAGMYNQTYGAHWYFDSSYWRADKNIIAPGFYQDSDETLKDFYDDIKLNLEDLRSIPKKYFSFKDNPDKIEIGTSAQAVQKLYPEIVSTNNTGKLSVAYDKLAVIALKGIDELYDMILELREENRLLKEELKKVKTWQS